ncbi:hypothetical protein D3C73_882550 [compost metagenome]
MVGAGHNQHIFAIVHLSPFLLFVNEPSRRPLVDSPKNNIPTIIVPAVPNPAVINNKTSSNIHFYTLAQLFHITPYSLNIFSNKHSFSKGLDVHEVNCVKAKL